jgi:cobyrinic acid a,c-diamide synthase
MRRMALLGPRIVIAGTHSGVGKTTVATGLMAALRSRGLSVGAAKVGPDFIDPSYHSLATGRRSRSLDAFLCGEDLLAPIAARASEGCNILIIEGVMGLFDGSGQPGCDGSTADIAKVLDAPVVLVVDAGAMAGSVAAVVHGFASLDPDVRLAGVVLNRVAGEGHDAMLRQALEPLGIPVIGTLFNHDALVWRERHLGLVPVAENADGVAESIAGLVPMIESSINLEEIVLLAQSAPDRPTAELGSARRVADCRVAVCAGPAFSFVYPDNLEILEAAGAELVYFDPLDAAGLPPGCTGLYVGGGFPEVYAEQLAANLPLLEELRRRVGTDLVTWAECGGFMVLTEAIDEHAMSGVLDGVRTSTGGSLSIGYRTVTTRQASFLGPEGTVLRGHEFHRSQADPPGDALHLVSPYGESDGGFLGPLLFASYLHQHLASTPELAERFVTAAAELQGSGA